MKFFVDVNNLSIIKTLHIFLLFVFTQHRNGKCHSTCFQQVPHLKLVVILGASSYNHTLKMSFSTSLRKFAKVSKPFGAVRNMASFYNAYQPPTDGFFGSSIKGEVIDNAVDIKQIRPGQRIDVPYEVTISSAMRDFWQSAFFTHDRMFTSTPFARALGLQDQTLPFGLMLFLAGSMSHADRAKVQVGFGNAHYHWPAFAGDTFKKSFVIRSLRSTSDKRQSIFTIECELINQRGIKVFSCEKKHVVSFRSSFLGCCYSTCF